MADSRSQGSGQALPDWWKRENQRRQLWVLIFLGVVLMLIAYYYWVSISGRTGVTGGVVFDTADHIVFVRRTTGKDPTVAIYAIRADGTDLRRLTDANDHSDMQS